MESETHKDLKQRVKAWLMQEHGFTEDEIEEEYQVHDGDTYYLVDVVGLNEEKSVAVECGHLSGTGEYKEKRLRAIQEAFDHFKRFSYIYAETEDLTQPELHERAAKSDSTADCSPEVSEVLQSHGLTTENAARFVEVATRLNRQDGADEIGVNVETMFRYKNAFEAMTDDERVQVIAWAGRYLCDRQGEQDG